MGKINYKKFTIRVFFSLIVTVIIFYFLFRQISLKDLLAGIKDVNMMYLVWFFIAITGAILVKAFRYKQFFSIRFRRLAIISAIHNFALNILPSRSGELVFLYLLKRSKEKYTKSFAGLIIFRLMDLLAVVVILSFSLLFIESVPAKFEGLFFISALLSFFVGALILSVVMFSNIYVSIINFFMNLFRLSRFRVLLKLSNYLKETLGYLGNINRGQLISIFSSSLLLWILSNVSVYFVLRSMLDIGILLSFIVNSFLILILLIPIQGFMGFGTAEAPLYLILLFLGFGKQVALSLSFVAHFATLFTAILLGVVAILALAYDRTI